MKEQSTEVVQQEPSFIERHSWLWVIAVIAAMIVIPAWSLQQSWEKASFDLSIPDWLTWVLSGLAAVVVLALAVSLARKFMNKETAKPKENIKSVETSKKEVKKDHAHLISFIFLLALAGYLFWYGFQSVCTGLWAQAHVGEAGLIILAALGIAFFGYKNRWVLYVTIAILAWNAAVNIHAKFEPPPYKYEDILLPADGSEVQATIPAGYRYSSTEHCEGAVITFSGPSVYGGHKPLDCYGHVISEAELPGTVIRYEMPMGEEKKIRVWYTIME